jgi:phosphatidylglycerol:prolipoprotein diacylglycerol transferase
LHPILVDLGTFDLPMLGETHLFLPTYGLLFAGGVLVAWMWFMRRAARSDLDPDRVFNLTFYTLLAGLLGAKLSLVIVDWDYYVSNPANLLGIVRAAGVLMGGVLAGALTFALYAWRTGLPMRELGDAIAAPLALAQAIGRLGCFAAGCCYGVETGGWCAVTFTDPAAAAQTGVKLNVPLVPTQLIQMCNDLALAVLLTWLWRKRPRPPGTVFWIYVLLYSVSRGIIEIWRGDAQRGLYFGDRVSTSQLLAIVGVVLAVTMLVVGWKRWRGVRA